MQLPAAVPACYLGLTCCAALRCCTYCAERRQGCWGAFSASPPTSALPSQSPQWQSLHCHPNTLGPTLTSSHPLAPWPQEDEEDYRRQFPDQYVAFADLAVAASEAVDLEEARPLAPEAQQAQQQQQDEEVRLRRAR